MPGYTFATGTPNITPAVYSVDDTETDLNTTPTATASNGVLTLTLDAGDYYAEWSAEGDVHRTGGVVIARDPDTYQDADAGSGGSSAVPVHKTSTYNAAVSDAVLADASGGNFTVTLPAPVAGDWVIVKNIGGTGVVTVAHHASENVDGASSVVIASQYVAKTFLSDGTDWWVV